MNAPHWATRPDTARGMRSFLAVALPESLRQALVRVQAAVPVGRPVDEDNLHLTLAFLDDQPDHALAALHDALVARSLPAARLDVSGIALFGGRVPRLLAADVVREPGLVALRDACLGAVREAGIALPRSRFRPHVTLVRFGPGIRDAGPRLERAVAALAGLRLPGMAAEAVGLYASTLTPAGPVYEELARYGLGGMQ